MKEAKLKIANTVCDAIFLIDGWDDSDFALEEYESALAEMLPVFHTVDQLNEYFIH